MPDCLVKVMLVFEVLRHSIIELKEMKQDSTLLKRQLQFLEQHLMEEGDITERMYRMGKSHRRDE